LQRILDGDRDDSLFEDLNKADKIIVAAILARLKDTSAPTDDQP
jgi:hypothetical protein